MKFDIHVLFELQYFNLKAASWNLKLSEIKHKNGIKLNFVEVQILWNKNSLSSRFGPALNWVLHNFSYTTTMKIKCGSYNNDDVSGRIATKPFKSVDSLYHLHYYYYIHRILNHFKVPEFWVWLIGKFELLKLLLWSIHERSQFLTRIEIKIFICQCPKSLNPISQRIY